MAEHAIVAPVSAATYTLAMRATWNGADLAEEKLRKLFPTGIISTTAEFCTAENKGWVRIFLYSHTPDNRYKVQATFKIGLGEDIPDEVIATMALMYS